MKKETRKKSSALVKSGGEAQSYTAWIADLKRRYRATQIKAAVAVNSALIEFYWNLGKKQKLNSELIEFMFAAPRGALAGGRKLRLKMAVSYEKVENGTMG